MTGNGPFKGLRQWLYHRLLANYWSLPVPTAILAVPLGVGMVMIDRAGLARWLAHEHLSPVASGGAAQYLASAAVGVNVALFALYFSLTLLVLTLATANLGVRLVDRWLERRPVRLTLAALSAALIYAIIVLAAVDPDADLPGLPLGALYLLLAFELAIVVMLAVALHDLGRTIFVDRSIAHLARDIAGQGPQIAGSRAHAGPWRTAIPARRNGYVEGIDLRAVRKALRDRPGAVRLPAAPGQHVLEGEPIALLECDLPPDADAHAAIVRAVPIGDYRSDGQGAVFQIRLLVEIAARAMSSAINDFYTALACADRLAEAIRAQASIWVEADAVPVCPDEPRIELPGQDLIGLFRDPLAAFRQSAAAYPPVAIRMIGNYARLAHRPDIARTGLAAFLRDQARELAQEAMARTHYRSDRDAIRDRLADFDERAAPGIATPGTATP